MMTETRSTSEFKEISPRAKVLIIDMQPTIKQNVRISQSLFDSSVNNLDDFSDLVVASAKTPKASEIPDLIERENKTILNLPSSLDGYAAVVITGSPFSSLPNETANGLFLVNFKKDLIDLIKKAKDRNVPMLGICFGEQIIAEALGGKVVPMQNKTVKEIWEAGWGKIRRSPGSTNDPVMKGLPDEFVAPENHKETVARIPEGAILLAENEFGVQGFRIGNIWGFEFHPERSIERVNKILSKESKINQITATGRKVEDVKRMEKDYHDEIGKIFSNFLKFAWHNVQ